LDEASAPVNGTLSALSVAYVDLSSEERDAYKHLLDELIRRLDDGERVRRFAIHGGELVAFTDRRLVAVRRRAFDFAVRRPRIRSIPYCSIDGLTIERVGSDAKALTFSIVGHRRARRFYFPSPLADRLVPLVPEPIPRSRS
jgi:hypothetical protein